MAIDTVCALLAAALSSSSTAYETAKVAEGIYAFLPTQTARPIVSGNSVAVIGEDGVLVVDSGHYPSATRRMIAEIRKLTDKPVRFLVNTHWHPDHVTGNSVYKDAFPDIAIVATAATRAEFEIDLPKSEAPAMKEMLVNVKQALQTGKRRSGKPLSFEEKAFFADAAEQAEEVIPDIEQGRHLPPSLTFEREVDVYLGRREVRVLFLGRGNTGGDAVIYVPDAKVVMTGDLVVYPSPYAFGSFLGEWAETMKKLAALDAVSIVPGHGPVLHDKAYVKLVTDLLETVTAQVGKAVKEGLSLEETRKRLDVESFRKQIADESAERNKAFRDYFLEPGVARAYREANEGPLHDEN